MAKKNSTKTATKEARENSIPKVMQLNNWAGIEINALPYDLAAFNFGAKPDEYNGEGQSDSKPNFLFIENNVEPNNGGLESVNDTIILNKPPTDYEFTGVCHLYENLLFCACKKPNQNDKLFFTVLPSRSSFNIETAEWELNNWYEIILHDVNAEQHLYPAETTITRSITDIEVFSSNLIVMCRTEKSTWTGEGATSEEYGEMFIGDYDTTMANHSVQNYPYVDEPTVAPTLTAHPSDIKEDDPNKQVSRLTFTYIYDNIFGTTTKSPASIIKTNVSPLDFNSSKYVTISCPIPIGHYITGVDIYCAMDDRETPIFCGHVDHDWTNEPIGVSTVTVSYNWLGALTDTSRWTMSSLQRPTLNTTRGADAEYITSCGENRLYMYGGSKKERLYIGGNAGNELSCAPGLGGAFIDIAPGTGQEIRKVLKHQTYNGSFTIVALTTHKNTNRSSRYNINETNITVTNDYATSGYVAERVPGAPGCSSYDGADSIINGLYSVTNHGLALTTHIQEKNNDITVNYCSQNIDSIFSGLLGVDVRKAKLFAIKNKIYFILPRVVETNTNDPREPMELSKILFCYDTSSKAWYTLSPFDEDQEVDIIHAMAQDYEGFWTGILLQSKTQLYLMPTSGDDINYYYDDDLKPLPNHPNVATNIQTHELSTAIPIKGIYNLCQLQINFDYICCPEGMDIWVEGYNYYGQHFKEDLHIQEEYMQRHKSYYLRIDQVCEKARLFIKGKAHYRLTHINMRVFAKSQSYGIHYGFDTRSEWLDTYGNEHEKHNRIKSYNDLERIIMT